MTTTPTSPPGYDDLSLPAPPGSSGIYPSARIGLLVDSPSLHIGTTVATRIRALDADLQILAARGGGNLLDGILLLASAGATTVWAVLLDVNTPPGTTSYPALYLYTYAGATVTRAILSFVFMANTNPSASAIRYTHMPMGTTAEVRERLLYGEEQLDSLADTSRIGRILDGAINLASGLAVIPVCLAPTNFEFTNTGDWFVLLPAGLAAVMGVIALASTTEAERRQSAYHDLRDRLLATPEGMSEEDALLAEAEAHERSLAPSLAAGVGNLTLTF